MTYLGCSICKLWWKGQCSQVWMISDILRSVALEPITDIPTSARQAPSFSFFLLFYHRDQKKNHLQVHLWHFPHSAITSRAELHSASILFVSSMFSNQQFRTRQHFTLFYFACLNHPHLGDCIKKHRLITLQLQFFSSSLFSLPNCCGRISKETFWFYLDCWTW